MRPFAALAATLALASADLPPPGVVSGEQAAAMVARGAALVDVRTPEEFAAGHAKGAISVPFDQIAARAGELGDRSRPVVLYCRTGRRSGIAAAELQRLGFTAVYDFRELAAWPGNLVRAPAGQ
jgi:rhodanese-related sulfurtransferase